MNRDGSIVDVHGACARARGLPHAMMGELVHIGSHAYGIVLALESNSVTIGLLDSTIQPGDTVEGVGSLPTVPIGPELRGRVIDPLGRPLDGAVPLSCTDQRSLSIHGFGPCERAPLSSPPLVTGVKIVDAFLPVKRGASVGLIGHAGTGKTDLLKTIFLAHQGLPRVWAAIGWERTAIDHLAQSLRSSGASKSTTIVATPSDAPPALHVLAPFAAIAIAQNECRTTHSDVFLAIDELNRHGEAYRTMRAAADGVDPERIPEAEIFSLHARILGSAGQHQAAGSVGTLTLFATMDLPPGPPPRNYHTVASIIDRALFFDPDRFRKGIRPAVIPPRIISKHAHGCAPCLAPLLPSIRVDLALYLESAEIASRFEHLDLTTRRQVRRGERIVELLKQPASTPVTLAEQLSGLLAAREGLLDLLPTSDVSSFTRELHEHLRVTCSELFSSLKPDRRPTENELESLATAARTFVERRLGMTLDLAREHLKCEDIKAAAGWDKSWSRVRKEKLTEFLRRDNLPAYVRQKLTAELQS